MSAYTRAKVFNGVGARSETFVRFSWCTVHQPHRAHRDLGLVACLPVPTSGAPGRWPVRPVDQIFNLSSAPVREGDRNRAARPPAERPVLSLMAERAEARGGAGPAQ
jgi:hypothetical protein